MTESSLSPPPLSGGHTAQSPRSLNPWEVFLASCASILKLSEDTVASLAWTWVCSQGWRPPPRKEDGQTPCYATSARGHLRGQKEIPKSAHKPPGAAKKATALCGEADMGHRCLAMFPWGPSTQNSIENPRNSGCLGRRWCLLSLSSQGCWCCQWNNRNKYFQGCSWTKVHIFTLYDSICLDFT